jgi:hypothetical protein
VVAGGATAAGAGAAGAATVVVFVVFVVVVVVVFLAGAVVVDATFVVVTVAGLGVSAAGAGAGAAASRVKASAEGVFATGATATHEPFVGRPRSLTTAGFFDVTQSARGVLCVVAAGAVPVSTECATPAGNAADATMMAAATKRRTNRVVLI